MEEPRWLAAISDSVRVCIIRSLGEVGEATAAELRERTHSSDATLRRHLGTLVELGLVRARRGESDGLTRGRPAARFSLRPEARTKLAELLGALR